MKAKHPATSFPGISWGHVDHEISRKVLTEGGTDAEILQAISFATKCLSDDRHRPDVDTSVYDYRAKALDVVLEFYGDNELRLAILALQQFWNT